MQLTYLNKLICRSETSKIVLGITHCKFYGVMCLPGERMAKMQEKMNGGRAKNIPRNASHTPAR
jgi:hypothetical protein